jgi:hypothetical protein
MIGLLKGFIQLHILIEQVHGVSGSVNSWCTYNEMCSYIHVYRLLGLFLGNDFSMLMVLTGGRALVHGMLT